MCKIVQINIETTALVLVEYNTVLHRLLVETPMEHWSSIHWYIDFLVTYSQRFMISFSCTLFLEILLFIHYLIVSIYIYIDTYIFKQYTAVIGYTALNRVMWAANENSTSVCWGYSTMRQEIYITFKLWIGKSIFLVSNPYNSQF